MKEKESRLVKVKTSRKIGEGVTITGDCPEKGVCAHLKWSLCPGWIVDKRPCKNMDKYRSEFSANPVSAPEITVYCKKDLPRKK